MFKFFCIGFFVLMSSLLIYTQNGDLTDKESLEKGNQIVEEARKEIGVGKLIANLSSFQIATKSTSDLKGEEMANTKELYVLLSDKILSVYSTTKPFEIKSTSIWNGEKYKKTSESISPDGQRVVRDATNGEMRSDLSKFVKNPEALEKMKKAAAPNPREKLNDDLWNEVVPFILIHPLETKPEFRYVGKAKSGDREANVVDTISKSGRSIRLLFDSTTNQLLLMTEKFKGFDGDYENNYYYSNREKVDNVLIPKKIKVERKFTPTGKAANVTFAYIEVTDFKINPKFKANLFDVN